VPTVTATVVAVNPPPGDGLKTPMPSVPAVARYDAGMFALSCVGETYFVGIPCEPITTDDDGMKFVPTTAICMSTGEIGSCVGATDRMVGTGFDVAAVTVNAMLPLVPPPGAGELTETWCVPAFASALAGIDAARCVVSMNVVASAAPSQSACDAGTNSEPDSVIAVAALPCGALVGETCVSVGIGLSAGMTMSVSAICTP